MREKITQNENRFREFNDSIRCKSIHIIGVPEEEKVAENLLEEIIAEYFCNLGKETDIQIQEEKRSPIKINESRPMPKHVIVKFAKYKEKNS